ncbi:MULTISPECIES: HipA family kinase [Dermacoccus]|uniref:HipA domain-containing protein n=1 Tax=Dermacoccus abyssi TaxID=322596 RepID=A0ABX5Z9H8_9MICO|nr:MULTISPECIES: HipA family kinase [Dermacoccus]KLO61972.1 aminotransferase class I and II [Dermacoccus sp. PE3]MBE7372445.1 aminotransferase class I and II [Dermacoccus barathri]QEH93258.1 HipA domain-containing protein [Dermacoccus abyssi]
MLETITATRYVVPLKEGGSLPGVVEGSDDGTWVVKFRGAGQGLKVLVAEVVVGELARALGLRVPALKLVELPEPIAKYEADEEVQDLLTASLGLNLGVDLLPGAFAYDGSQPPPADEAATILWLDAFTANIDRTPHNPNLVRWHGKTWCIDHGAALYFHYSWPSKGSNPERFAAQRFEATSHIMWGVATEAAATHERLSAQVDAQLLERILGLVPDEWLEATDAMPTPTDVRGAYVENLLARLASPQAWSPAHAEGAR